MLRGAALGALAKHGAGGKVIAQVEVNWRVQAHWPKGVQLLFNDSFVNWQKVL